MKQELKIFYHLKFQQIQENLSKNIDKENNRIAKTIDNIYIIKHVEIPITIVECGFLSNPEEEKKLLDDEYQNKIAWGIYNGIIDYFYNNSQGIIIDFL